MVEGGCGVPLSLLSASVAATGQYHGGEMTSSYWQSIILPCKDLSLQWFQGADPEQCTEG